QRIEWRTITTTTLNGVMKGIQDRRQAIVRPEDYARWLDAKTAGSEVRDVLEPIGDEEMTAHAVSARVNRAGNDGADLVEPVECEREGVGGWGSWVMRAVRKCRRCMRGGGGRVR